MENSKDDVEIVLDIKKLDERREVLSTNQHSSPNTSFGIHRLNIYFKSHMEISMFSPLRKEDVFWLRGRHPLMTKSIQIDYVNQDIMPLENTVEKTLAVLHEELQHLEAMPTQWHEAMTTQAVGCIRDTVKLVAPQNNVLDVGMEVIFKYSTTVDETELKTEVKANVRSICKKDVESARRRNSRSAAATDLQIRSDPVTEYDSEKGSDCDETCSICLEALFGPGRAATTVGCTHKFHVYCIGTWGKKHRTCPICRCIFHTNFFLEHVI